MALAPLQDEWWDDPENQPIGPRNRGEEWWNRGLPPEQWTDFPPPGWGTGGGVAGPGQLPVGFPGQVGTLEPGRTYNPVEGWDTGKLNDPNRTAGIGGKADAKYDFMRWVQNTGITGAQARGNLNRFTDDPNMRALYPNARVVGDDKIDFGDGFGPVDVIRGSDQGWWWGPDADAGKGGPSPPSDGGPRSPGGLQPYDPGGQGRPIPGGDQHGDLVAPWTKEFQYANYDPAAAFTETFNPEAYVAPEWTGEFKAPTAEEAMAEPGTQFELAEGQKGIERSAAAGGTLLTGGTLKDLAKYRQGVAAQRYGDVYGRRAGEYQQRVGEFEAGKAHGLAAYGANLGAKQAAYGSRRDVNQEAYQRGRDIWQTGYGKARQEFDLARDVFERNQEKKFNRLRSLAELGRF